MWSCRPSELLSISDEYVAYCLDEAVYYFGKHVETELASIKQTKNEKSERYEARKHREFLRLLGAQDQIQYASPVATT